MNNDKELIHKIKKASEIEKNELLEEIYKDYYKLVCFVISRYIKNRLDVEEIANDTFLKLYQNLFSIKTSIKYYLTTIAKNLSLDYLKKENNKIVLDDELIYSIKDNNYNSNENYQEIIEYLENILSKNEVTIVLNHIVYDITFKKLSKTLKIPENSVKTIYYRAINKIKSKGGKL